MTDLHDDPDLPLEDIPPVPVTEVAGDGPQPPADWGQDGQGGES